MIARTLASTVVAALSATASLGADPIVRLENAWVRPANEGQPATPLYVEVTSDVPLSLVGATSEVSRGATLFTSELSGERAIAKPIGRIDVPAGGRLRLAPRGPFVELRDITRVVRTGESIGFALEFATADGKPIRAGARAVVRGIMPRPTERPDGTSDAVTTPSTDGVPMPGAAN